MSGETARITDRSDARNDALAERAGEDTLRFVRFIDAAPERVWTAITTPDGLAAWIGRGVAIDLVPGGRFELALTEDCRMDGRVIDIDPGRHLTIEWHETSDGESAPHGTLPGNKSMVSFDLKPDSTGGTILTFTHSRMNDGETMIGFGAGWHAGLEALVGMFTPGWVDADGRYAILEPKYRALISPES